MKMYKKPISKQQLKDYLKVKDLSSNLDHAVGMLYSRIEGVLKDAHPNTDIKVHRNNPIVTVEDNYDNLLIGPNNISRSSVYTHYVDKNHVLRTHTSAEIPKIMRHLAIDNSWNDVLILVPGLAYRRDVLDKKHLGQIHMLDIWRVVKTKQVKQIKKSDLIKSVYSIAETAAPGWQLRIEDSPHPYTNGGIEVNAINSDGRDIEILECGLIKPEILEKNGLSSKLYSGWALGMGLDRLVMTLKDLPDVRYLRSSNPKIASQMQNLDKYQPVSNQPAIMRDLSYSVPAAYVEEDISQDIIAAIGDDILALEEIEILQETNYVDLPAQAVENLGIQPNQKNVLVRITLRHLEKTLTKEKAKSIYEKIYPLINYGKGGYEA